MKKIHCITLASVLAMVGGSPAAESKTNWITAENAARQSNRTAAIAARIPTRDERLWLIEEERRIWEERNAAYGGPGVGTFAQRNAAYKLTPREQARENLRLRRSPRAIRWRKLPTIRPPQSGGKNPPQTTNPRL